MRMIRLASGMIIISLGCWTGCQKALDTKPGKDEGIKLDPYNTKAGSGAIQGTRGAVARTITMNDLSNLRLFIESASLATGTMPNKETILAELKRSPDAKNLVALIDDGSIILTDIKRREGVWAYEKLAPQQGGNVVTHTGVERMTAQQLNDMLKNQ